jgi:hypothetical protein
MIRLRLFKVSMIEFLAKEFNGEEKRDPFLTSARRKCKNATLFGINIR